MNKTNNIIMTVVAAAVLVAMNVGVFMAAGNGVMSPVNNMLLWGAFVALNVASILWAVSMLGLQPIVVTVSYVAGGALAFFGVRGMTDVSVAEITTAGATYGAFGALAVGNATTKVRLAFFNKGQVPFVFIITALLIVDAILNSQVFNAGTTVLINAVLLPFVVAGGVVGLVWSLLNNRLGISKTPKELLAEKDAAAGILDEPSRVEEEKKTVIPVPKKETANKKSVPAAKPIKKVKKTEPIAPVKKAKPAPAPKPVPQPVVAEPAPAPKPVPVAAKPAPAPKPEPEPVVAKAASSEGGKEFIPLDIDKTSGENLSDEVSAAKEKKPAFEIPTFDAALYASGSRKQESDTDAVVKEPEPPVEAPLEKPIVEQVPAEAKSEEKSAEKSNGNDFLGGHLDLLNKLK